MTDAENAYGDYAPGSGFYVGSRNFDHKRLFQCVIKYGSSLKDTGVYDQKCFENDWGTFYLITMGVTNEWSLETLQRYFGNDDVDSFIKKRAEILSDAVKLGKNAEQYLKKIEHTNGSSTGENE